MSYQRLQRARFFGQAQWKCEIDSQNTGSEHDVREQKESPGVRISQTWMAPESALAKRGSGFFHAARIGSDFSLTPPTLSRQAPSLLAPLPLAARRSPHPAAKPLRPRGFSHRLAMSKALSLCVPIAQLFRISLDRIWLSREDNISRSIAASRSSFFFPITPPRNSF